jgi:glycosyltransferase involved in cell wall biosynthesis
MPYNDVSFTVLMSVYYKDDPTLLSRALLSVFNSTVIPDYVVLVGDGPLPIRITTVIDSFRIHQQFQFIQLENNIGLARALNFAIEYISTNYIIRFDSDDVNVPERFEKLLAILNAGYDLVGSAILEVEKDGSPVAIRLLPESKEKIIRFARRRNPFNHMSVAYRTDFVKKCGGYPDIYLKEDYGLWATMIKQGANVINLPDVLVHVTAGKEMYKRRGGLKYILSEYSLQRHLVAAGIKPLFWGIIDGVLRSIIFVLPSSVRGFFYLRFLRRNPSTK